MTKRIYLTKFRDVNRGVRCEVMFVWSDETLRLGTMWFKNSQLNSGVEFQFNHRVLGCVFDAINVDTEMHLIALIADALGEADFHGEWRPSSFRDFQVYPIPDEDKS